MSKIKINIKKRLVFLLCIATLIFICLMIRVGYLQLGKGEWLREKALSQQTRDIPIDAKRGTIYDRNGKELAVSVSKSTVWVKPVEVKDKKTTAKTLSQILEDDENEIYKKIDNKKLGLVKIARWIDDDKANAIRKEKIPGVWVAQDNKRYYPFGSFASYVLGHVSSDNTGIAGIELQYDKKLKGTSGRLMVSTDASGREIKLGEEKYNDPSAGLSLVLTIDEVIQHYTEKALETAFEVNTPKRVSAIVMDPKTGDILAMAAKPDYNPNDPKTPTYPSFEEELNKYSEKDKIKGWFKMWRNPLVNDTYEPGSTFKLITSVAGLEEKAVTPEDEFYDKGFLMVADRKIKCWRYYNPHGQETFRQAVQNSCNPVFVEVAQRLGVDKMYEYINDFGLTKQTGIDLPGEGKGLIYDKGVVGPVELATISFGQSISVTPIQLATAVSAIANDGKLMKPKLVKELVDSRGDVVESIKPEVVKQVISKETSKTMLSIIESVVSEGSGKAAYLPGYRVGGKTGTAQKVIDGRYANGHYVASFVGVAPCDNPQVVALVIIDEPGGETHFGSTTGGPVIKEIMYNTLRYLDVKPKYTQEEKEEIVKPKILVPQVRNLTLEKASEILNSKGLNFIVEPNMYASGKEKVIDVFPKPGTEVSVESNLILYVQK